MQMVGSPGSGVGFAPGLQSPPAVDAFGFGSFGASAPPFQQQQQQRGGSLVNTGAGMDSQFSEFASFSSNRIVQASCDQGPEGDAGKLVQKLVADQRFKEALECRTLASIRQEVARRTPLWEQAKAQQDFVGALEHREAIERLKGELQLLEAKAPAWSLPPIAGHRTIHDMAKEIEHEAGKQKANQFMSMYRTSLSDNMRKGDLTALAKLKDDAEVKMALFKKSEPLIEQAQLDRWKLVLQNCVSELGQGVEALQSIRKELASVHADFSAVTKLLGAPKSTTYINGLVEMCRLVKRIQLALLHYSVSQKCSISDLNSLCMRADNSRRELQAFVEQMKLSTVSTTVDQPTTDFSKDAFSTGVCEICLLPGRVQQMGEEVATLRWGGTLFHSACANFYCNRISATPPPKF